MYAIYVTLYTLFHDLSLDAIDNIYSGGNNNNRCDITRNILHIINLLISYTRKTRRYMQKLDPLAFGLT